MGLSSTSFGSDKRERGMMILDPDQYG
jgi:hypothetical protein